MSPTYWSFTRADCARPLRERQRRDGLRRRFRESAQELRGHLLTPLRLIGERGAEHLTERPVGPGPARSPGGRGWQPATGRLHGELPGRA